MQGIINIFTRKQPIIGGGIKVGGKEMFEGGISFDAELSYQFQSTSRMTKYEVESGQVINLSLIHI